MVMSQQARAGWNVVISEMLIGARRNLPPDVEALFTKTPPIKDVIEFALGDNGAYFVSFRDHDGQTYCRHYNLPNPLTEYLYHSHPQVIRDLATLSISIGPYDSYYAHDKTSASWSNLPPALEKAVLNRLESQDPWKCVWREGGREAPSFVSLGSDGSFFMRTVSGGGSWDLKGKSEGMQGTNKFLEDSPNFQGVAVSTAFCQKVDYMLIHTRAYIFSPTIQLPTSCFLHPERHSPTYQSTHGQITIRWLQHCLLQFRRLLPFPRSHKRDQHPHRSHH
jgi:hypothetical protein